jgi:hypothetical protein
MRSRRAIDQTGLPLGPEPGHPPVRTLTGDTQLLGHVSHRPTITDHPGHQQMTTMQIQTSISVGHEDLLVGEDVRHLH